MFYGEHHIKWKPGLASSQRAAERGSQLAVLEGDGAVLSVLVLAERGPTTARTPSPPPWLCCLSNKSNSHSSLGYGKQPEARHTAQHPGSEPAPKGRKKLVSPSRLPKPTPPNLPPKPVLVGIAILFHMSFYGQLRGCEVCVVVGFIFLQ